MESYPEYDENLVNERIEREEEYLKSLIDDINEVKKFVKDAKRVYIAIAEDWKRDVLSVAKQKKNMKEVMKVLMSDDRFKPLAKDIQSFIKRLFKEEIEFADIDEYRVIDENRDFIEKETSLEIHLNPDKVPESKRKASMPGKPAIYIE